MSIENWVVKLVPVGVGMEVEVTQYHLGKDQIPTFEAPSRS